MYLAFLIIFIIANKYITNITKVYITTVSLYIIHTATCFDIFMSSDQHTNNINKGLYR